MHESLYVSLEDERDILRQAVHFMRLEGSDEATIIDRCQGMVRLLADGNRSVAWERVETLGIDPSPLLLHTWSSERLRWMVNASEEELRALAEGDEWRPPVYGHNDAAGALTLEQWALAVRMEREGGYSAGGKWIALWDHRSRRPLYRISHASPRFRDADEYRRSKDGNEERIDAVCADSTAATRVASYFKPEIFKAEAARWGWKKRNYEEQLKFWCSRPGRKPDEIEDLVMYVVDQMFSYKGLGVPGKPLIRKWCARYFDQFYTTTLGPDGRRIRKPTDARWSDTETDRGTLADQKVLDREYGKEAQPLAGNAGWNPDREDDS